MVAIIIYSTMGDRSVYVKEQKLDSVFDHKNENSQNIMQSREFSWNLANCHNTEFKSKEGSNRDYKSIEFINLDR